uniref:DUF3817 domain-containing protein n=1 Tax=Ascaris lumbricoides TaxID=6252 RepID=A0A0M3ICV1_ASCLU
MMGMLHACFIAEIFFALLFFAIKKYFLPPLSRWI